MNEDCTQGIKNAKEIEKLDARTAMMFEHLNEGLEKLDKKLDKLQSDVDDLKKNLPTLIEESVEARWKSGVYSTIKWMLATVFVAIVGVTVKLFIGG